jgi:hypothetical protein
MGRFLSGSSSSNSSLSNGFSAGVITTFKTSAAGVMVPTWAQGGLMELWGTGGGGGYGGGRGGNAAFANGLKLLVPPNAQAMEIQIGTSGSNVIVSGKAGDGGATVLKIDGVEILNLGGGIGGNSYNIDQPGQARLLGTDVTYYYSHGSDNAYSTSFTVGAQLLLEGLSVQMTSIGPGHASYANNTGTYPLTESSPFGAGALGAGTGASYNRVASPGFLAIRFLGNGSAA